MTRYYLLLSFLLSFSLSFGTPNYSIHNLLDTPHSLSVVDDPLIRTEPALPLQTDDVTIFFNAKEGDGGLEGFSGTVYAHTGVITSESTSSSDWKYVVAEWGTANDKVKMTRVGEDLYSISFNIQTFYNISPGEQVEQLAFVFRNVNGSVSGRASGGGDIFTDVDATGSGIRISVSRPQDQSVFIQGDSVQVAVSLSSQATLSISDNGNPIFSSITEAANFTYLPSGVGDHTLTFSATTNNGTATANRVFTVLAGNQTILSPPEGIRPGINYENDSYIFAIEAPGKNNVILLCSENNYEPDTDFLMNKSPNGDLFWLEVPINIFEGGNNTYQYLVDGLITVADPYSELVLDPQNDPLIPTSLGQDLPSYPSGASGRVSVLDKEKTIYDWVNTDFKKPQKTDLVIYELLVRDFLEDHSYRSLIDTLDYLENLGINAIELMPIHEFEGNNSWGYNPSFHLAVDKYYGSREELKEFIDAAHGRGIAVILDVVFNHVFSQSPLAQLYWDNNSFSPTEDNPWLNIVPRHPFNVGYDMNHESSYTKDWVKRNLEQWIQEYRFDGFRFDLSKGLTQTNSLGDEALMARYDPSRVSILKEYADYIWSISPDAYVIMEHFADNLEERELSDYGMMLWGNMNFQFGEAAMGYSSNLEWADYKARGYSDPHLITYMESHDEERLAYKIKNFGNSNGTYNTRDQNTAMERLEALSVIYYSLPGPKMLWQFGELGYDFSINYCQNGTINESCRVDPKPIRWNYLNDESRNALKEITTDMIYLKTTFPTFSTADYRFNGTDPYRKTVKLTHPEMNVVSMANFNINSASVFPIFQQEGTWYEYFSNDSLIVEDLNMGINLEAGEYRLYTSKKIEKRVGQVTSVVNNLSQEPIHAYPNPIIAGGELAVEIEKSIFPLIAKLYAPDGRMIPLKHIQLNNQTRLRLPSKLTNGVYFLHLLVNGRVYTDKIQIK